MAGDVIEVPVWYDFASTLCFVAHRHYGRLAPEIEGLGLRLRWQPLDLARLVGWPRGVEVPAERRENARRVARELDVTARVPRTWQDSREVGAAALWLGAGPRGDGFRERVFSAVFERGLGCDEPGACAAWLRDLGVEAPAGELARAREALEAQTLRAADAQVTAVPTMMLDELPFGGVQNEHATLSMLRRWSTRRRRREAASDG